MKKKWVKKKPPKAHAPTYRFLDWMVCSKCALVYLKNEATQKEIRKPCPGAERPD